MTRVLTGLLICLLLLGGGVLLLDSLSSSSPSYTSRSAAASTSDCKAPLTYRIASIDARYAITEGELRQVMDRVAALWSEAAGQRLLRYAPDGTIAVHLIYSDNQRHADQERQMGDRIETLQRRYQTKDRAHARLTRTFETRLDAYERLLDRHNAAVDQFNADVTALQSSGGIPEDQRADIVRRERRLNEMAKEVNRTRRAIDSLRSEVNQKSSELNDLAETINRRIADYNRQFSQSQEFDQGKYQQINGEERIDIYQFSSRDELALVLAHEVGHALGLRHLDAPTAIMHYLMDEQEIGNLRLTPKDEAAIRALCGS
jgi:chromosome segregation ATPase